MVGDFKEKEFESVTRRIKTPCGDFYITLCYNEKGILDRTFVDGKNMSTCQKCLMQGISRLVSLSLQNKVPKSHIIEELNNLRCNKQTAIMPKDTHMSCPHGFAYVLKNTPWNINDRRKEEE